MRLMWVSTAVILAVLTAGPKLRAGAAAEAVFDEYFRASLELYPETGTRLGLTPEMGYRCHPAALNDRSERQDRASYELLRRTRARLDALPPSEFTPDELEDARILRWYIDIELTGERFSDLPYTIHPLFGVQAALVGLLTELHPVTSRADVEAYIARIRAMPRCIEQVRRRLARQEALGIRPPAFVHDTVIGALVDLTSGPAAENVFHAALIGKMEGVGELSPSERAACARRAERILERRVKPAFERLLADVRASQARAGEEAGVWRLPDGGAYYAWCLKANTTTSLSPEEVHQLGLREVGRLQTEIRARLADLGIACEGGFDELLSRYWEFQQRPENSSRFFYPEGEETSAQVLADYRDIIAQAWERLPQAFSEIPRTRVDVEPVPAYRQASLSAFYEPASIDGRRPGVFKVNPGRAPRKPGMASLAYHEAVPGHHLQLALQRERTENRMFKQLLWFTGYGEGWALYAERLALELGWFEDAHAEIASLLSQLFRAVRLVVDTGIHERRWSRAEALDYMRANLGAGSEAEVDRYIAWPGQACAYMVGELKLLELRERMRAAQGERFDLREFHRLVLEGGSLPLDVLEAKLDAYVAEQPPPH